MDQDEIDEVEEDFNEIDTSQDGITPQDYRRQELEEHVSSGQPIIREPRLSTVFLKRLLTSRGFNLTKLRIHGIVSTMDQVRLICQACHRLQDLVLQLFEDENVRNSFLFRLMQFTQLVYFLSAHIRVVSSDAPRSRLASHPLAFIQRYVSQRRRPSRDRIEMQHNITPNWFQESSLAC
jgi:hypothetical protein